MRRLAWALLATLLAAAVPLADAAEEPDSLFEIDLEDPAGDVIKTGGQRSSRTGLDLRAFSSRVEGSEVVQRVTVESNRDWWQGDELTLNHMYRDAGNGTAYWVEIRHIFREGDFYSFASLRNGSFENKTDIRVETTLEGNTIVVRLDRTAFPPDATCFQPYIKFESSFAGRRERAKALEGLDLLTRVPSDCRLPGRGEHARPPVPDPPELVLNVPVHTTSVPTPESKGPLLQPWVFLGLGGVAAVALGLRHISKRP